MRCDSEHSSTSLVVGVLSVSRCMRRRPSGLGWSGLVIVQAVVGSEGGRLGVGDRGHVALEARLRGDRRAGGQVGVRGVGMTCTAWLPTPRNEPMRRVVDFIHVSPGGGGGYPAFATTRRWRRQLRRWRQRWRRRQRSRWRRSRRRCRWLRIWGPTPGSWTRGVITQRSAA